MEPRSCYVRRTTETKGEKVEGPDAAFKVEFGR
jgi:hypothetical protein